MLIRNPSKEYRIHMPQDFSRRSFVKTSATALAAAPGILSAQGANDKLNLGWIGTGSRGNYL